MPAIRNGDLAVARHPGRSAPSECWIVAERAVSDLLLLRRLVKLKEE
jgi:hypothetical protein